VVRTVRPGLAGLISANVAASIAGIPYLTYIPILVAVRTQDNHAPAHQLLS